MLTCMKCFSSLGAFIILLVGLAMTGITIYGFKHSQLFLDDTSKSHSILGVMIAADILIVLGAIMGIYGLRKKNAFLICVFQIFVIVFLIVFFALGIAAEVLPSSFFGSDCNGSENPTIALAASTQQKAISSFCKTDAINPNVGCTCSLSDNTIDTNYPNTKDIVKTIYTNRNPTGFSTVLSCPVNQTNFTPDELNMAKALGAIQDLLGCSGWCDDALQKFPIYRFTDVNKGVPINGFCFTELKSEVGKYANVIGLGSLFTAFFLLLVCVVNTCICCDPSRRNLGIKNRFVYMKDGQYQKL